MVNLRIVNIFAWNLQTYIALINHIELLSKHVETISKPARLIVYMLYHYIQHLHPVHIISTCIYIYIYYGNMIYHVNALRASALGLAPAVAAEAACLGHGGAKGGEGGWRGRRCSIGFDRFL